MGARRCKGELYGGVAQRFHRGEICWRKYGQFGNGTTTSSFVPIQVSNLTGVTAIASGNRSSLAMKSDGTVWAWGSNQYGQLGNGTTTDSHVPIQVSNLYLLALTISPGTLPNATQGVSYSQAITASGGSGGYTFSISSGALPSGLNLSSAGILSGTPMAAGSYNFAIQVIGSASDTATQSYALTVGGSIGITTATLPAGTVGVLYNQTLAATGGSGSGYTWSVSFGALPAGLTLSSVGVLSGTPTTAGTSSFTVQVTDSAGNSTTQAFSSFTVYNGLSITATALPNATQGVPYSTTLAATGGSGGYTWSVNSGVLPEGLSLSTDGVISGTPTTVGSFTFTVKVTDSVGNTAISGFAVYNPVNITTSSLPAGTVGVSYSSALAATGGTGTYTWSATGLPAGLTIDTGTGTISGTPTSAAGSPFTATVTATDTASKSDSKGFTVAIGTPAMVISPVNSTGTGDAYSQDITGDASYNQTLSVTGGTGPYTYSVSSGSLPAGLSLSSDGVLSGTITAPAGSYTFTVQVTDAYGSTGTQSYTLVASAPAITTSSTAPPVVTNGGSYDTTLTASGGTGPYTFSLSTGTLPDGLMLSGSGELSGAITAPAGQYTFTILVTDANGYSATQSYTLTVQAATVQVTGVSLDKGGDTLTVGDSDQLTATVAPANATDQSVTWTSSNNSVATVDSTGKVTAVGQGTATITATTADGGYTANCAVTVQAATVQVAGVSLDKGSDTLTVGDNDQLTATVAPASATDQSVTWTSSNNSVATVDLTGKVTAVDQGTATITATTADGGYTATCTVTVNPATVPVTNNCLTLKPDVVTLDVGQKVDVVATAVYASVYSDDLVDVTQLAIWSSSNNQVATVSVGRITAVSPGTSVVSAVYGILTGTVRVMVNIPAPPPTPQPVFTGLTVSPGGVTLDTGQQSDAVATAFYSNGSTANVTAQSYWSSSNYQVATVSAGRITAVSPGKATISARYDKKTGTMTVVVVAVISGGGGGNSVQPVAPVQPVVPVGPVPPVTPTEPVIPVQPVIPIQPVVPVQPVTPPVPPVVPIPPVTATAQPIKSQSALVQPAKAPDPVHHNPVIPAVAAGATGLGLFAALAIAGKKHARDALLLLLPHRVVSVAISAQAVKPGVASLVFDDKRRRPERVTADLVSESGKIVARMVVISRGRATNVPLPGLQGRIMVKIRGYRNISKNKSLEIG